MYIFPAGLITTVERNRGGGGGLDTGLLSTPPAAEVGWGSEDTNLPPFSPTLTNMEKALVYWSRIHERTISLRFLGIILRPLRFEVSLYNVYIKNQYQTTSSRRNPLLEVIVNSKVENSKDFCPNEVQEIGLLRNDPAGNVWFSEDCQWYTFCQ